MDDLVERVAMALQHVRNADVRWFDVRERNRDKYRADARAALAEIERSHTLVERPRPESEPTTDQGMAGALVFTDREPSD